MSRSIAAFLLLASCCFALDRPNDPTLDLPVEKPLPPGHYNRPPDPPENGDDGPPHFYGQEVKSENGTIFYVIDISGSMAYDRQEYLGPDGATHMGNRLDRAKAELVRSIS